jgi:hypothetical protein
MDFQRLQFILQLLDVRSSGILNVKTMNSSGSCSKGRLTDVTFETPITMLDERVNRVEKWHELIGAATIMPNVKQKVTRQAVYVV